MGPLDQETGAPKPHAARFRLSHPHMLFCGLHLLAGIANQTGRLHKLLQAVDLVITTNACASLSTAVQLSQTQTASRALAVIGVIVDLRLEARGHDEGGALEDGCHEQCGDAAECGC